MSHNVQARRFDIPTTPLVDLALATGRIEFVEARSGRWPDVVVRFPEDAHTPTGFTTGSRDALLRVLSAVGAGLMLAALLPQEREQLDVELRSGEPSPFDATTCVSTSPMAGDGVEVGSEGVA